MTWFRISTGDSRSASRPASSQSPAPAALASPSDSQAARLAGQIKSVLLPLLSERGHFPRQLLCPRLSRHAIRRSARGNFWRNNTMTFDNTKRGDSGLLTRRI
jgi:hypothetical protein